jgi:hypothetical protein
MIRFVFLIIMGFHLEVGGQARCHPYWDPLMLLGRESRYDLDFDGGCVRDLCPRAEVWGVFFRNRNVDKRLGHLRRIWPRHRNRKRRHVKTSWDSAAGRREDP